jgi:type VI secretion system secreted protein VgrG
MKADSEEIRLFTVPAMAGVLSCLLIFLPACNRSATVIPGRDYSGAAAEHVSPEPAPGTVRVYSHLFPDTFTVTGVYGEAALNRSFNYSVTFRAPFSSRDITAWPGHTATIMLSRPDIPPAFINGYISEAAIAPAAGSEITITLVPWTGLLRNVSNIAVFQDMTVPDIIWTVLARYPFADYSMKLSGTYPVESLFLQYRETDMNFLCRIMEHTGISAAFEHGDGRHTLVLTDSCATASDGPPLQVFSLALSDTLNPLSAVSYNNRLTADRYVLKDYDRSAAGNPELIGSASAPAEDGVPHLELYDFPGAFRDTGSAARTAALRLQELQVSRFTLTGTVMATVLEPGMLFVCASGSADTFRVTGHTLNISRDEIYGLQSACMIQAIPAGTPFRPARLTP